MFEQIKEFCDSFLEMGLPGFDLMIYQHGKCILRYQNGYSDLENKIPISGKERLNIYSCSKPITCTAALQLWEKGLFDLEDKLSDYMPEFTEMTVRTSDGIQKAKNPILIKHLFEMTAGFSYDTGSTQLQKCFAETGGRCPTRETMKYLAKEPLMFEPGTRWLYSLCHDVLAALVEVISGEKFEVYVQKNIFDVLGMRHSTFMLPEAELDTISQQYLFTGGKAVNIGKLISPYKLGSEYASGGAGCISTVEDYMLFLEALRTHRLLKPETLKLMTTDRLTPKQKEQNWTYRLSGYGLGVRCPLDGGMYSDFGWGGAACSYLAVDPKNEISLFFGTHLRQSPVQTIRAKLYRMTYAELINPAEYDRLQDELLTQCQYQLTY